MDDLSRVIGRIEAFQEATEKRLGSIEKKIDSLYMFRWKIAGAITAALLAGEIILHTVGVP